MSVNPDFAGEFIARHIGPGQADQADMLRFLEVESLDALMAQVVPPSIHLSGLLNLPTPLNEPQALLEIKAIAQQNQVLRNYIGQGYYGTHTPNVV
ncbi:MAG: hypothetical protein NWS57_01560, partial [Burkholderiaceae bacterium]|nr:hypothetical protein [Burkholderiaceae bacterium]